jgi:multidrug resistance protein MdtO
MITGTAARLANSPPGWLGWLQRELAPFPGRTEMTIRIVVTVVLVTIISMALQVPLAAYSAFFVLFVTKENRSLTVLTGAVMTVGITVATLLSLFLYQFTFDHPELRFPVMAGLVFTGMFLSRVFVIGPLGFVLGFFTALQQTFLEGVANTDVLVRTLLWLWMAVVYPIAITIFINQILLPADPWPALVRALQHRLDIVADVLQRIIREGATGGQTNNVLLEQATRGSSPLLALLHFAESKDAALKCRHTSLVASISASEHLLTATATVEFRDREALSAADLRCAQRLLEDITQLRRVLPEHEPVLAARREAVPRADLPQLRELQFAAESFRDGLIRYISEEPTPAAAPPKKSLFAPDAFTNPAHVHFALKVTLAAMTCYLIYTGLDWPGIGTAFITCCFIALENTAATLRKGWLRLSGCLAGGLLGYFALICLIPYMESITSLVLLAAAGAALAGWVAAGTDRISYAGLQGAFAFFLCIFQTYAPEVNFTTARDRLVGILLGIFVSAVIYRYVWPEHAGDALRVTLARILRTLGRLLLIPLTSAAIPAEKGEADRLFGSIKKDLDNSLRLAELVAVENVIVKGPEHLSSEKLEQLTATTQALSLITIALLSRTKVEEWRQLDPPVQQAETLLRIRAAEQLEQTAIFIEQGRREKSFGLEPALSHWNQAVAHVAGNDRLRLVRRLVLQIQEEV